MYQIENICKNSSQKLYVVSKSINKSINSISKSSYHNILKQINFNQLYGNHYQSHHRQDIFQNYLQKPTVHFGEDSEKIDQMSNSSSHSLNYLKSYHNIDIFPKGLYNIGNSCYMNATLQCLLHLPQFSTYFLTQFPKSQQNKPVSSQLYHIISQMSKRQNKQSLNISQLKKQLSQKKSQYKNTIQQDSQQYLINLLEILNIELTRINTKFIYKELSNNPKITNISLLSEEWWNYYLTIDNSIICDVFQGQMISTIKCQICQKISVTFDNIWGLPITFQKNMTVYQLLVKTLKSETSVQDYYCSQCKKHRNCVKILQFFKLPKYLVIQLKRFQYEKGQKKKKKQSVNINKTINLNNLLNQHSNINQKCKYNLKGIVHHQGQSQYGHYYAQVYCNTLKQWYNINDSTVIPITNINQVSKTAYLLFYQQQF